MKTVNIRIEGDPDDVAATITLLTGLLQLVGEPSREYLTEAKTVRRYLRVLPPPALEPRTPVAAVWTLSEERSAELIEQWKRPHQAGKATRWSKPRYVPKDANR